MPDAVGERCRLLRDVAAVQAVVAEDPGRALQLVEPLLASDVPDPWVLAAMACSHLGELDDLKGFVNTALKHKKEFLVPRRKLDMMELAAEVALYERRPVTLTGRLGAIGSLIIRTPWPKEPIDPEGLERVALNLLRLDRIQDVEPLLEPRADGVAPGLRTRIRDALGRLGFSIDDDGSSDPIFLVGGGSSALRAHVARHPRMFEGSPAAEASRDGGRAVGLVDRLVEAHALADAFPSARFVYVPGSQAEADVSVEGLSGRLHMVDPRLLQDSLDDAWDQVLAYVGESPATQPSAQLY